MAENHSEIIIIGGGVIGIACAYYLAKEGKQVTILEQNRVGSGSSYGNCGLISPSHALPLTVPGQVTRGLKWMFKNDAPFYIKPSLDLSRIHWLLKFAGRCNDQNMREALIARKILLEESIKLYDNLVKQEQLDCDWQKGGTLFVFKSEAGFDDYKKTNDLLADHDLGATPFTGKALAKLEPALKGGVFGAWHYKMDGHLRPDRLMIAWRKVVESSGVRIVENCRVEKFCFDKNKIDSVETTKGSFSGDQMVLAAGAWSQKMASQLSLKIPIQPGKGYSITMSRPGICPKLPLSLMEAKMAVTPWKSGYRLGGTMEFSGFDESINQKRVAALRRGARDYLVDPEGEIVEDFWYGWRPMTYDGLPIIDRSPKHSNLIIAAGHNMLGMSMATATGKLVEELVNQKEPFVNLAPYSIKRF